MSGLRNYVHYLRKPYELQKITINALDTPSSDYEKSMRMDVSDVTICSLIYKSSEYADFLLRGIKKWTPKGYSFYFIANDPTDELLRHMENNKIPFFLHRNKNPAEWYIPCVYRAWNYAVEKCETPIIVLLNSDMYPSPKWLEGLLKYLNEETVVTSTLIEPAHRAGLPVFQGMFKGNFGISPKTFNEQAFLEEAERIRWEGVRRNPGPYMPLAIYKDVFIKAGKFPEGNLGGTGLSNPGISGDKIFFDKLEIMGVKHLVSMESIVYHIKEGEESEGRSYTRSQIKAIFKDILMKCIQ
jgi:hypothetical protein